MIDERILRQFQEIGRDLYVAGLVSSHGGNMSVRFGDRLLIKRRGAMLGRLKEGDLVETGLDKLDSGIRIKVLSIRRVPHDSLEPKVKSLNYLNIVMGKLEARDRAQLVVLAYESGLVQPGAGR